ncbi:general transcription factor 3C polypeptide 3-like [Diadema antillarum]|uniref:general transcription factor 3C polypeptide 3-like n=1 Tax=Diadema antillarum TaxID=105358 RepID=UPI003A86C1B0
MSPSALRFAKNSVPLLHARASLYTKLGENKKAMESYQNIVKALPPDESHKCLQLARDIVKACHGFGDTSMAIETLEMIFSKHPDLIHSEDVNNLAELYICSRQYQRAIQVMCDHCGVGLKVANLEAAFIEGLEPEGLEVDIPDGLPIDLRIKLAICLIHSRHLLSVAAVTAPLFGESPELMGDLYLDVAEAYVDINHYKEAKPILAALLEAKNYNLPAVWLRYAECLNSMGELAESSQAYKEVLKQVPRHVDARLALAAIEQQLGRGESALQALTLDQTEYQEDQALSRQDVQLLFRQSTLLHTQGHDREFLEKGLSLISKYLQKDQEDYANFSVVSKSEWFGLIQKLCHSLGAAKRCGDAQDIISKTLDSNLFEKEGDKQKKLKFMLVCATFLNGNFDKAFNNIRDFVTKGGDKTNLMNLFSLIVTNSVGTRHHRFCLRLTIRLYSDSQALSVINGHNALHTSSYKHAIGEYARAYHHDPSDPFLSLCLGICLFALASRRFTLNKDSIIAQGFSCLRQYQRLRGDTQETNYNIGRALQQVALNYLAVHYYHKALTLPPIIPADPRFNLQPQIAFNLSLIYRQSGNVEMARELLHTYCVI